MIEIVMEYHTIGIKVHSALIWEEEKKHTSQLTVIELG